MKQFVLIFLSLLGGNVSGQIEVINTSISQPEIKQLYRFYNNTLQINGIEIDSTSLVMIGKDTLECSDNKCYYRSYSKNKQDTFIIYNRGRSVYKEVFEVKVLPKLKVYYGILRDTLVTKRYLLENPGLILSYEPEIYIPCSYVTSFEVSIIKNDNTEGMLSSDYLFEEGYLSEKKMIKKIKSSHGIGNKFSQKQLRRIKRMKKGDVVWFKYAVFSCPSCVSTIKFIDLKLTLID